MALSKRNKYWHYDFIYRGKRYQGSTGQTNINKAKLAEAKLRSDVALEAFGISAPRPAPMFKTFIEGRFFEHVRQHNSAKPRTVAFYEEKSRRLMEYPPFHNARLDEVEESMVAEYTLWRSQQTKKRNGAGTIGPASINREIATLRKALTLAYEWKLIARRPKLRTLPGEKNRDFVVSGDMETAYLAATSYPLHHAAILMLDLGLRPEECVRIRKEDITSDAVTVRTGKTKNAARSIPQTERTRAVIEWLGVLWEESEFLFPGHRKESHLTRSALDHMHARIRNREGFPEAFVLYALRHTFGTRLAQAGANPYEIKTLMGHSDIRVSQKYVHPSSESVELAMKRKELLDKVLRGEAVPAILGERDTIPG